jgi:hypothetical protein
MAARVARRMIVGRRPARAGPAVSVGWQLVRVGCRASDLRATTPSLRCPRRHSSAPAQVSLRQGLGSSGGGQPQISPQPWRFGWPRATFEGGYSEIAWRVSGIEGRSPRCSPARAWPRPGAKVPLEKPCIIVARGDGASGEAAEGACYEQEHEPDCPACRAPISGVQWSIAREC